MSRDNVHGDPITLHALRLALESRVRSTGGRPALEGATEIQKIPLRPEDWSRLEALAAHLSRQGVSATAGQVASVMVHSRYCTLVYARTGNDLETARRLGLDRRTVKEKVDPALLLRLLPSADGGRELAEDAGDDR